MTARPKKPFQGRIEAVLCAGIFNHFGVAPGCLQALDKGLAGRRWIVIVAGSVKDADRPVSHVGIVLIGGVAIGIEGQVGRELQAGTVPRLQ